MVLFQEWANIGPTSYFAAKYVRDSLQPTLYKTPLIVTGVDVKVAFNVANNK
jgi:hypothetical protein